MPDLSDHIALAKSNLYDAEQAIWHLRTHIDPQGWKAIKQYVDTQIRYQLLLSQKETGPVIQMITPKEATHA